MVYLAENMLRNYAFIAKDQPNMCNKTIAYMDPMGMCFWDLLGNSCLSWMKQMKLMKRDP